MLRDVRCREAWLQALHLLGNLLLFFGPGSVINLEDNKSLMLFELQWVPSPIHLVFGISNFLSSADFFAAKFISITKKSASTCDDGGEELMSNWKMSKCFWCSNRRRLNVKKVLNKNALVHSTQPSGFQVRGVTSPLLAESRARTSLSLRNNHWAWLKRPKF